MKKICLALIMALTSSTSAAWAEENPTQETGASQVSAPTLLMAQVKADSDVTSYQYESRLPDEKSNQPYDIAAGQPAYGGESQPEANKLTRSPSRPKVVTYGDNSSQAPATAAPASPKPKNTSNSQGQATTFEYNSQPEEKPAQKKVATPVEEPKDQTSKIAPRPRKSTESTTFEYNRSTPAEESVAVKPPKTAPAQPSKPQAQAQAAMEQEETPRVKKASKVTGTTFEYSRPGQADESADQAKEPMAVKPPQKATAQPSKPQAPAAVEQDETPQVKKAQKKTATTFEYNRPVQDDGPVEKNTNLAPATPSEKSAEIKKAEPKKTVEKKSEETQVSSQSEAPAPAEEPQDKEDNKVKAPPKSEVKLTTIAERTQELELARPQSGRAQAKVTKNNKTADPNGAQVQRTVGEFAGIYVNCPRNQEETCAEASDYFRSQFPDDQTGPYIMIRKDGQGYVAPDNERSLSFTWEKSGPDTLIITMEAANLRHKKSEYQVNGRYLHNLDSGDLFYLSLTDAEWNIEPEPFNKLRARKEKEMREMERLEKAQKKREMKEKAKNEQSAN